MDWAMLVATALATVAAAVSAFVAVGQARAARDSGRDALAARNEAREARDESARLAGEANAAFVRQAEAQEQANELKREELRKPAWSDPRHVNGDTYSMSNTSGRAIRVDRFESEPDGTEGLIRLRGPEDNFYAIGDSFDFMVMARLSLRPRKLTIFWRYDDEPEAEESRFIVTL